MSSGFESCDNTSEGYHLLSIFFQAVLASLIYELGYPHNFMQ